MAGIDLHSHTRYSDGTFEPAETVNLALERGLDVLAVSDHDTTEGLGEVAEAAKGTGLEIVPATEFSTVTRAGASTSSPTGSTGERRSSRTSSPA